MASSKMLRTLGQIVLNNTKKLNVNIGQNTIKLRNYSAAAYTTRYAEFETISVTAPFDHVLHVELNRPDKRNAMNRQMFREILDCFHEINDDKQCRAVVISAAGKDFSAGLDFEDMRDIISHAQNQKDDIARKAKFLRNIVILLQKSFNVMAKCAKPVIATVHGGCIGSALDMVSSVDIRLCSQDAYFSAREVDVGMVADLGTLQRFPKIVGNDSIVREIAFTGKNISSKDSKEMGLVSKVYADKETLLQAAIELAKEIAGKSPVAVQGTKTALNYSRDHSVRDGLDFMSNLNMCLLQSEDLIKAATAVSMKSDKYPQFEDL